jgi:hypothetical protein
MVRVALCLCGPIRKVAPTRGLPGALLCGVRTFLQRSMNASGHPTSLGFSSYHKSTTRTPLLCYLSEISVLSYLSE